MTVIGGGSRNPLWLQVLANILGVPVAVGAGDARLGAALLAAAYVPGFQHPAFPRAPQVAATCQPQPDQVQSYEALYRDWCAAAS
jgi:xylulokinase